MSFASINGARAFELSLGIPLYGAWQADVSLSAPGAIASPVSLVLGNLTLVGAVYRQGAFGGSQHARLVAGAGGWRKQVTAQGYASPSGVLLSTVLRDAAMSVGERVNVASDAPVGRFFAREAAPASRVLAQLVDGGWFIDGAGVTQIAQRSSPAIASPFTVVDFDTARGEAEIATEDYASWTPGATFSAPQLDGPQTVSFVRFSSDNDGTLRLRVLVSS